MQMNLADLQAKCTKLGLTVTQKGKRPSKDDYVQALRAHFLPAGGLKYTEMTPMLCFAEWNLKPEEAAEMWTSPKWVAQRKLNGCRAILHFVKGVGIFAHSRTISVKTFRYQELSDQFLFHKHVPDFSATIDCEVMIDKPIDTRGYTAKGEVTKTSLHSTTSALHLDATQSRKLQEAQNAPLVAHVFDIMEMNGTNLMGMSLRSRLRILDTFKNEQLPEEVRPYFQFPVFVNEGKRALYDGIVAEGGEGVILKHLDSRYENSTSRSRLGWVKCKKRIEFDAFVTGFIRGEPGTGWENMVGALEFSINTEKGPHILGYGQNLKFENRQKVSIYDPATNTVKLHSAMFGKVAEISGVEISGRSLRLTHCTIDRWRSKEGPDHKTKDQCTTSMADLRAAAEWVSG